MHYTKFSFVLAHSLMLLLLVTSACAQTPQINSKDNPAVPADIVNDSTMNTNNTDINTFLRNAEIVEAYTFQKDRWKTVADTTANGVHGFKHIKHIEKLQNADATAIKNILSDFTTYEATDYIAKCGWHPDLAFIFNKEGQKISVLVSTINDCNVLKMYKKEEKILVKMVTPGRTPLVELAKIIFPNEYATVPTVLEISEPTINNSPLTDSNDSTQTPSSPVDSLRNN